jgi:hypothetical protein
LSTGTWIVVAIVLVVLAAVVAFAGAKRVRVRRARTRFLQERFGDEYARVVRRRHRHSGERELKARLAAHEALHIERLTPAARQAHTDTWRDIQFYFVDSPSMAVREAEHLLVAVMSERGYPTDDFESRVAALSVDDPDLAVKYRAAYGSHQLAEAGAEPLDQLLDAFLTFRMLIDTLLERPAREPELEQATPPEPTAEEPRTEIEPEPTTHPDGEG